MRICALSYEEVIKRHPTEVTKILTNLRKGKSKNREATAIELDWSYECCVQIKGYTLAEVFGGVVEADQEERSELSVDDRVADQVSRTTVWLQAKLNRWCGQSDPIPAPPELVQGLRDKFEEEDREQARLKAMTLTERQEKIDELLGQLSKNPGFMAVIVPRRGQGR
jgi:hypothetical protein